MILRLMALTVMFLGLALGYAALSWGASDRVTAAWLSLAAGAVVFLLGRRLLLAVGNR